MEIYEGSGDSFVSKLAALVGRQSDQCPACSQRVEYLVQLDGYTYAQPCACQLYQGNMPPTWGPINKTEYQ